MYSSVPWLAVCAAITFVMMCINSSQTSRHLHFSFFSIQIIKEKLDSEGLGIFLVSSFMDEFFSKSKDNDEQRRSFELYHYNGIKRSNESNKVPIESITQKWYCLGKQN
mgnify:FL=1